MKEDQTNERPINVSCTTPALEKLIPRKLALSLKSKTITVLGEERESGAFYYVRVRMVFAALMSLFPQRTKGLQRLRNQMIKQKDYISVSLKECEEVTPAFF